MLEIISRKEAKARGLTRYFTGKQCPNGHCSKRLVSSYGCIACSKSAQKKWRKKNPEKLAIIDRRFRQKNLDKRRVNQALWREKNRQKIRDRARENRAKNPKQWRERDARWKHNNHDKVRESYRRWYAKHKDRPLSRQRKITDLLLVLREEMPDLLKEFDL